MKGKAYSVKKYLLKKSHLAGLPQAAGLSLRVITGEGRLPTLPRHRASPLVEEA